MKYNLIRDGVKVELEIVKQDGYPGQAIMYNTVRSDDRNVAYALSVYKIEKH